MGLGGGLLARHPALLRRSWQVPAGQEVDLGRSAVSPSNPSHPPGAPCAASLQQTLRPPALCVFLPAVETTKQAATQAAQSAKETVTGVSFCGCIVWVWRVGLSLWPRALPLPATPTHPCSPAANPHPSLAHP